MISGEQEIDAPPSFPKAQASRGIPRLCRTLAAPCSIAWREPRRWFHSNSTRRRLSILEQRLACGCSGMANAWSGRVASPGSCCQSSLPSAPPHPIPRTLPLLTHQVPSLSSPHLFPTPSHPVLTQCSCALPGPAQGHWEGAAQSLDVANKKARQGPPGLYPHPCPGRLWLGVSGGVSAGAGWRAFCKGEAAAGNTPTGLIPSGRCAPSNGAGRHSWQA